MNTSPSIYSLTLITFLFLSASSWTVSAIVAFLTTTQKINNKIYIVWSLKYLQFDAFIYARWIAAGLATFLAILTWVELALVVIYRSSFLKRAQTAPDLPPPKPRGVTGGALNFANNIGNPAPAGNAAAVVGGSANAGENAN
ncbi:hypothetical protein FRC17_005542, partial [Serendipita sp. 399]